MKRMIKASSDFKIYKGYDITYNLYGKGEYTVQYCGDDVMFKTEDEAKSFIDRISEEDEIFCSSGWGNDWYARKNRETGADYYVLSAPVGTARVFHDLYKNLYHAEVRLRDGRNRSSSNMRGLMPCMNWAEGILFGRQGSTI